MTWKIDRSDNRVVASFAGKLDTASGIASAQAFVEALGRDACDVVFDIRDMAGYDTEARIAWQDSVGPKRKLIRSLVVVGGRPLVKLGASALALFLRIPHRFVDTVQDIAERS